MTLSPIALFAYNRPEHLRKVIDALSRNTEAASSKLFVFSDAPKNPTDEEAVGRVRAQIRRISGFKSVDLIEQQTNQGVARSIVGGVSNLTATYGKVIVLEDDLLPSAHFLSYMNVALGMYEMEEDVAGIAGYFFPTDAQLADTFFLKVAECWGWATWKRAWSEFEPSGEKLLQELQRRGLQHEFDFEGSYPYTRMLKDQIDGKNDSWAIRWYASIFLRSRLSLYPRSSQIQNIGADGSGVHEAATNAYHHVSWGEPVRVERLPVRESVHARRAFAQGLRRGRAPLLRRALSKIARLRLRRERGAP